MILMYATYILFVSFCIFLLLTLFTWAYNENDSSWGSNKTTQKVTMRPSHMQGLGQQSQLSVQNRHIASEMIRC